VGNGKESITILVIGGMQSAACVTRIEKALRSVNGVETVGINLLTRMATIRHVSATRPEELTAVVTEVGYECSLAARSGDPSAAQPSVDSSEVMASRRSRFVAGAVLTFILLIVDQLGGDSKNRMLWLFLLATPVQITVGWEYYGGFLRALRAWRFNTDSLVVIASTAAYLQGVLAFVGQVTNDPDLDKWPPLFSASAVILTVVALGRWLEARARASTRKLWGSLDEMMPREARVVRDGREQIIPAGVVALGDQVVVKPGEKIPVDGVIMEGASEVNEALISGEGRPVPKVKGDKVLVASVNGTGVLRIRATGVGDRTSLAQIARLVSDAQTAKAPVQQIADRISAVFVPVVLLLAAATFSVWYLGPILAQRFLTSWVSQLSADNWLGFLKESPAVSAALLPTIALLVVACPVALGLATPMVVLVATGLGARHGLLFKGGQAIEAAGRITDVVFDKTGVLTDGVFCAKEIVPAEGVLTEELLNLAGSLEACSEHALAKGVLQEVKKSTLLLRRVENFEKLPGRGLRGRIGGRTYVLGSQALLKERSVKMDGSLAKRIEELEASGATLIFLAEEKGRLLGVLALTDHVKETSAAAIAELRAQNRRLHLLSGDNTAAAAAVGVACGLKDEEIHGRMTTEEKIDFACELREKGRRVAMVGDGISDAPAMAAADVGIALGVGTDLAVEQGAIVLVSGDPRGVARTLRLARQALVLIRVNLLVAFSFNIVMIPLAVLNQLPIPLAATAMVATSALVALNSIRLSYFRMEELNVTLGPHPSAQPAAALPAHTPADLRAVSESMK
jgi:P-type Cu+ transporter